MIIDFQSVKGAGAQVGESAQFLIDARDALEALPEGTTGRSSTWPRHAEEELAETHQTLPTKHRTFEDPAFHKE